MLSFVLFVFYPLFSATFAILLQDIPMDAHNSLSVTDPGLHRESPGHRS